MNYFHGDSCYVQVSAVGFFMCVSTSKHGFFKNFKSFISSFYYYILGIHKHFSRSDTYFRFQTFHYQM